VTGDAPSFVVNGDEVALDRAFKTMRGAVLRALKLSRNDSRPIDAWELRTKGGEHVDMSRRITPADAGTILFLTLGVGAGGAR